MQVTLSVGKLKFRRESLTALVSIILRGLWLRLRKLSFCLDFYCKYFFNTCSFVSTFRHKNINLILFYVYPHLFNLILLLILFQPEWIKCLAMCGNVIYNVMSLRGILFTCYNSGTRYSVNRTYVSFEYV